MIEAWRVAAPEHSRTVDEMLSGRGPLHNGGRWNSPGRRAVYLGGSLALASLELLVRLKAPDVLRRYRRLRVLIPETVITELTLRDLPDWWDGPLLDPATQAVGDRWLESLESVVLRVPSAVVVGEVNYVANPVHPDFAELEPGSIADFRYDPRLAGSRESGHLRRPGVSRYVSPSRSTPASG